MGEIVFFGEFFWDHVFFLAKKNSKKPLNYGMLTLGFIPPSGLKVMKFRFFLEFSTARSRKT